MFSPTDGELFSSGGSHEQSSGSAAEQCKSPLPEGKGICPLLVTNQDIHVVSTRCKSLKIKIKKREILQFSFFISVFFFLIPKCRSFPFSPQALGLDGNYREALDMLNRGIKIATEKDLKVSRCSFHACVVSKALAGLFVRPHCS